MNAQPQREETVAPDVRRRLLSWFHQNRRTLPWRQKRTPYRVWISEIMLQQTRVDQVTPYFLRFIKKFPSVRELARASQQAVLKAWEGLGYYSRARNIHKTARYLSHRHRGVFPRTYRELLLLPGIGPYTAAAIGSLAFGLDLAVVDGNVERVLSRFMGYGGPLRSGEGRQKVQQWANDFLVPGKAGAVNEALMELGAVCCLPRRPRCGSCPLAVKCRAYAEGDPEAYPRKKARKKIPHKIVGAGVVVNRRGEVLIAKRKNDSMLGGLWEFPGGTLEPGESVKNCVRRELHEELGIEADVGERLVTVHHAYSHFTIDLHAHWARVRRGRPRAIHCADFVWVSVEDLKKYPLSKADLMISQSLRKAAENFPMIGKIRPPKYPFLLSRAGRRLS